MREPPPETSDEQVLRAVRQEWRDDVDSVEHLPVGFGAHHWLARAGDRPALFVTLDALGARHDLASLTASYAGAGALAASGLEFVHAGLAPWAVPLGDGALSVTGWLDGAQPDCLDAEATAALLRRLHAAPAPGDLPAWRPLVDADLAGVLARRVSVPWTAGPHGELAREALAARICDVGRWVAAYLRLAGVAGERPWVATHGEPGHHNQLLTPDGLRLVDWESLRLAPAERDLRTLGIGDQEMLEMFDLEWRLDEISQYAAWFEAPHTGTDSDAVALAGLLEELDRPEWSGPS